MNISVTANDIRNGACGSFRRCPVALAIRRVVKNASEIIVGEKMAIIERGAATSRVELPPHVGAWIHEYDMTGDGAPIEFTLTGEA